MPKIGFSHGVLYRVMEKYSPEVFDVYAKSGSEILEICWNNLGETDQVLNAVPFVKHYPRLSIHLPTDLRYGTDEKTKMVLDKALELYQAVGAELLVAHPDVIDSTELMDSYPMAFAAENMDCRKNSHRSLEDMTHFFEAHPSWGMVLDVNHCFSNDPTMRLANDFIAAFRPRIKQIHLSGYVSLHEPLFQTKQEIIMDATKTLDVPIIIESTFTSVEDVKKEFDYIVGYLRI